MRVMETKFWGAFPSTHKNKSVSQETKRRPDPFGTFSQPITANKTHIQSGICEAPQLKQRRKGIVMQSSGVRLLPVLNTFVLVLAYLSLINAIFSLGLV